MKKLLYVTLGILLLSVFFVPPTAAVEEPLYTDAQEIIVQVPIEEMESGGVTVVVPQGDSAVAVSIVAYSPEVVELIDSKEDG